MMENDLTYIYNQVINDHNSNPYRNFRIESPTNYAEGENPSRGDAVKVYLEIENNVIKDCGFEGEGGAVFFASCSIMMTLIENGTIDQALELINKFVGMLLNSSVEENDEVYGKMLVFYGIRNYPARVKCATLPWFTLKAAIENSGAKITTENIL